MCLRSNALQVSFSFFLLQRRRRRRRKATRENKMRISRLTAVVVCVLAHGKERCAQEAKKKKGKKKKGERACVSFPVLLPLLYFLRFRFDRNRKERERKTTKKKKKKRKEPLPSPLFSFRLATYNANDDTTFTSNCLLSSFSLRESERQTTGHPVRVANTHQTNATGTAKERKKPKRRENEGHQGAARFRTYSLVLYTAVVCA